MPNSEAAHADIAHWIRSLLPSELWERYCHLTYAQMAHVPELAEYAEVLQEADKEWRRERTTHSH